MVRTYRWTHSQYQPRFNNKTHAICITNDMTLLKQSYNEWDKVEKPVVVPINYEGSDEKEVEMISKNNLKNN